MIIDKVTPYWTQEERDRLNATIREQTAIIEAVGAERARTAKDVYIGEKRLEEWHTLEKKANSIWREVENRYIKDRKAKGLLEDAKEIIESITKEDYLKYTEVNLEQVAQLQKGGAPEDSLAILKELAVESYDNCYNYVLRPVRVQLNGLTETPDGTDKVIAMVEKQVAQWYVKPQPTHFPIPYSKPTDALAFISQKQAIIDQISGDATIDRFSVQLRIEKFKDLKASLGISTDKLLSTALAIFAQNNDFSKGNKTASHRRVVIPLKDYAKLLGYDVEEKHALDNARKKVKKDLDILYNLSFEWEEIINGKLESFSSVRLLTAKEYRGGNISITFSPEIADHLVARGLITQYNTGMLKLDERRPNAYYIMRKLEEHYNMDTNQRNNRHDRIGIETILAVTDLPSFKEVEEKDRGHWERRIKEPLEEALDYLTHEKLLKNWEYTHAKGVPLTEEEAQTITDYNTFSKLYLHFTPVEKVDHTERQGRRSTERKKTQSRKKS